MKPSIRLRVGIYDSFWEIPIETITDARLENITDLVEQEIKMLADICENFADGISINLLAEEYRVLNGAQYVETL